MSSERALRVFEGHRQRPAALGRRQGLRLPASRSLRVPLLWNGKWPLGEASGCSLARSHSQNSSPILVPSARRAATTRQLASRQSPARSLHTSIHPAGWPSSRAPPCCCVGQLFSRLALAKSLRLIIQQASELSEPSWRDNSHRPGATRWQQLRCGAVLSLEM